MPISVLGESVWGQSPMVLPEYGGALVLLLLLSSVAGAQQPYHVRVESTGWRLSGFDVEWVSVRWESARRSNGFVYQKVVRESRGLFGTETPIVDETVVVSPEPPPTTCGDEQPYSQLVGHKEIGGVKAEHFRRGTGADVTEVWVAPALYCVALAGEVRRSVWNIPVSRYELRLVDLRLGEPAAALFEARR